MRVRAIWCCLWFGVMPWQVYQSQCHYRRGYWRHLWLNVQQATVWATFRECADDVKFEYEVNPSWRFVWGQMFRWTHQSNPTFHKTNDYVKLNTEIMVDNGNHHL